MSFLARHSRRIPWLFDALTALAYLGGVIWRAFFVLRSHDPRSYVYSDMELYISLGKRLASATYYPSLNDITHPPGMPWLVSFLYTHDHSFKLLVLLQLLIAALVPLAIGAVAALAFGRSTARLAIIVSSFYFPFIDYSGFFLAEIYMMFFVPATMALFLWVVRFRHPSARIAGALLTGVAVSATVSFKLVALPAMFGFVFLYWLFFEEKAAPSDREQPEAAKAQGPGWQARIRQLLLGRKAIVAAAFVVGMVPGMTALAVQCTHLNAGRFCLVSNKGPADFLLGHYGRIKGIKLKGKDGSVFAFGNPSSFQRGYTEEKEVDFGMADGPANSREAWRWIHAHPSEAIALSFEHVYELLGASFTWPSIWDDYWPSVELSQMEFTYLFFIPSLIICVDVLRKRGLLGFLQSRELLVLSPFAGVVVGVMIATGEPRYRLPYDGIFIVLSMEFFRRFWEERASRRAAERISTPAPSPALVPATASLATADSANDLDWDAEPAASHDAARTAAP
jgi:hypothetical protein